MYTTRPNRSGTRGSQTARAGTGNRQVSRPRQTSTGSTRSSKARQSARGQPTKQRPRTHRSPQQSARERHAQKERQKRRLEWRNAFFAAVFIVAAARFLFWPLRIDKTSMGNNFKNGQIVFTSALMTGIKRGTVVVLKDGVWENSGKELCRIIGLPGERVTIYNGDVFINGEMINESYADGETLVAEDTDKTITFSLSDEQYFLLYDDRQVFSDSRSKGELTKDQFSSVVLFSRK